MAHYIAYYIVPNRPALPWVGLPFEVGDSYASYARDDVEEVAELLTPANFTYSYCELVEDPA